MKRRERILLRPGAGHDAHDEIVQRTRCRRMREGAVLPRTERGHRQVEQEAADHATSRGERAPLVPKQQ